MGFVQHRIAGFVALAANSSLALVSQTRKERTVKDPFTNTAAYVFRQADCKGALYPQGNKKEPLLNEVLLPKVACAPDPTQKQTKRKTQAKSNIKLLLQQVKEEYGIPGLVCSVSVNGQTTYVDALGLSDVENGVQCSEDTVMRIASVSKALTSVAVGLLMQENKIDIDAPIQTYVPDFPLKEVNQKKVVLTVRHLLSNVSGIRGYNHSKDGQPLESSKEGNHQSTQLAKSQSRTQGDEFFIKNHYDTVKEALTLFSNDPLRFEPGTNYLYSTYGWILVSAAVESASGKTFLDYMKMLCQDLDLNSVAPEQNDPLIRHRSRYYRRNAKGRLENTPYVDNSYKWAGGGFVSNIHDLIKLGNVLLSLYQGCTDTQHKGYLRRDIIQALWTPSDVTIGKVSKKCKDLGYGLGWMIRKRRNYTSDIPVEVYHTGGAVGASSILSIVPNDDGVVKASNLSCKETRETCNESIGPNGIVVAIIVNMQEVDLAETASRIAEYSKVYLS